MTDELTRPLGLKRDAKQSLSRRPWRLGLVAAVLVLAAAGAFAWLRFPAPPTPPKSSTPAEPATPRTTPKPETGTARDDNAAGKAIQAPGASQDEEAHSEPLVPMQPEGTIEPATPVPQIRRQEAGLAHLPDPSLIERGASGVIPKRGPDGARPMDVYSRPPATTGNFGVARIVLIVGGLGISQTSSQDAIRELPGAVTLAFAAYGNSLGRWMQAARKKGHELLLQVPMEPFGDPANNPGPHTLKAGVTAEENMADLHWAMSRITNYVGVMNFLGGKLLTTPASLKPVFDDLARRGLLFVDDGSIKNTMSEQTAKASLLPYARAQIAIDAVRTRRDIAARLDDLVQQARRTGLAIGVANAFPDSINMIAQFAGSADKLGIEITPVSAIVSDPERGRK